MGYPKYKQGTRKLSCNGKEELDDKSVFSPNMLIRNYFLRF